MELTKTYLPIIISVFALLVSLITLWLSHIRKGTIKMVRPSVIFFGRDGIGSMATKVFLRTLLYSTADKGQYIESMYVKLTKYGKTTTFNIWTYGEAKDIKRGSGLFVGKQGVEANHHFLLPKQASTEFTAGDYKLGVYVKLVGRKPKQICGQNLTVSKKEAKGLKSLHAGLYFDWQPDAQSYETYLEDKTEEVYVKQMAKAMHNFR